MAAVRRKSVPPLVYPPALIALGREEYKACCAKLWSSDSMYDCGHRFGAPESEHVDRHLAAVFDAAILADRRRLAARLKPWLESRRL